MQLLHPAQRSLAMQKGTYLGGTDIEQLRQRGDIVAIARQGGLQRMHIGRERGVDKRRGHGFFPQPVRVFQDPGQLRLDLQRCHQPFCQEVEDFGGHNVHRVYGRRTLFQQHFLSAARRCRRPSRPAQSSRSVP
jgi:hypothetical protein